MCTLKQHVGGALLLQPAWHTRAAGWWDGCREGLPLGDSHHAVHPPPPLVSLLAVVWGDALFVAVQQLDLVSCPGLLILPTSSSPPDTTPGCCWCVHCTCAGCTTSTHGQTPAAGMLVGCCSSRHSTWEVLLARHLGWHAPCCCWWGSNEGCCHEPSHCTASPAILSSKKSSCTCTSTPTCLVAHL
jgi:hypothetical protein